MTSEVYKCFHERRRNRSELLRLRSVIAAIATCVAVYSGTAPILQAASEEDLPGSNSGGVRRAPTLTAEPERVIVSDGSGSSQIKWDTGNGSVGFVFVTEELGKPVPFASGSRGNQVAPWIKEHSYLFELYGDNQRQTLFAKVTVSGSAGSASAQTNGVMAIYRPLGPNCWISNGFVLLGFTSVRPDQCEQPFQPSLQHRLGPSMLDETFSLASPSSFASMESFFIAACTSQSWLQARMRDVSGELRMPKRSALPQVWRGAGSR